MLNHRYVHSKPLAHSVLHKLDTCSIGILVFEKSVTRNLREANQNSNSNISIKTKTKLEHIKKFFWYYGVPYIIHLGLLCYRKLNHNRCSIRSVLLLWFAYLYGFFFLIIILLEGWFMFICLSLKDHHHLKHEQVPRINAEGCLFCLEARTPRNWHLRI